MSTKFYKVYGKPTYGSGRTELICRVEIQDSDECRTEFIRNFYANFKAIFGIFTEEDYNESHPYFRFGNKGCKFKTND